MKRKLALLLAAVMTLSTLPMNVFAASDNKVTHTYPSLEDGSLLYDRQLGVNAAVAEEDAVEIARVGTNLEIEFKGALISKSAFRLSLSNAQFFYRAAGGQGGTATEAEVAAFFQAQGWDTARIIDSASVDASTTDLDDYAGGNLTYDAASGTWFDTDDGGQYRGIYFAPGTGKNVTESFALAVDRGETTADVYLDTTIGDGDKIVIPLVILTEDQTQPVTVTVSDAYASSGVSSSTYTISLGVAGGTTAKFDGVKTGRDTVILDKLIIAETRTRTMGKVGEWSFRIEAPTGYKFTGAIDESSVIAYGLGGTVCKSVTLPHNRRMEIVMTGAAKSDVILGRVEISNLEIEPINDSTWGDITGLKIVDLEDSGITNYTFDSVIGKRLDYGLTLSAANSKEGVPELFTGVFERTSSASATILSEKLEDDAFKLMEIKLEENSAASWWTAGRNTKLVLPEGVRVRAVEVTDGSNIYLADGDSVAVNASGDNIYDGATSKLIAIDQNEIILKDVSKLSGTAKAEAKKASISLDIWVSISNSMAGKDIELEVTGGGMSGDALPEPLVVAKAVAPVTVETNVSTISVGRNSQSTADIIIKETYAGALRENSEILLSMVDEYGSPLENDFRFLNAKTEVTEGDLDIDFKIGGRSNYTGLGKLGTGVMQILVETDSTEASTITLSDIRVSTSTTLPGNEKEAYKLLVFGSAIAQNFDMEGDEDSGEFTDVMEDAGLMIDYARTTAASSVGGFDVNAPFEITTDPSKGEMYFIVDGARKAIDEEAKYPRNVNGVVLLSVRLVGEAFDRKIVWDDYKKEATVVLSNDKDDNVKFTVGSPYYRKANTEMLMIYDDGVTVATPEIYDGRMFLPMRFLGEAMGINEDRIWFDEETGIASFNVH